MPDVEAVFRAEYGRAVAVLVRLLGDIDLAEEAAIAAVHSAARRAADTDWAQILALYDQLTVVAPSPVVALNRAVALAEVVGAAVALTEVDRLDLVGYHVYHVVRADLLARLGRGGEAVEAYRMAVALTDNAAERAFLTARATALSARLPPG